MQGQRCQVEEKAGEGDLGGNGRAKHQPHETPVMQQRHEVAPSKDRHGLGQWCGCLPADQENDKARQGAAGGEQQHIAHAHAFSQYATDGSATNGGNTDSRDKERQPACPVGIGGQGDDLALTGHGAQRVTGGAQGAGNE